ncbi:hypothetical protein N8T08_007144 [Aspergillus melleus]|uniref:Uncharacterized protein n=1 Tax=Aspergillus melleus TaxID=138277 RepID=A0ACC3AYS3_9EURO|nr:hypothetical protein N8T08_007144 [Aspergillus melleus]
MSVIQPYVEFRGVLYVDSMKESRIAPFREKIVTWISRFCGKHCMPNVTFVTTMWDGLNDDGIEEKLHRVELWKTSELLRDFLEDRRAQTRRSLARGAIANRYSMLTDLKLQIYIEISTGTNIDETEAAKWLKSYERLTYDTNNSSKRANASSEGLRPHQGGQEQHQNNQQLSGTGNTHTTDNQPHNGGDGF